MWETWLQKVTDPDTGKFYEQRDKNGNMIKGTSARRKRLNYENRL